MNAKSGESGFDAGIYGKVEDKDQFLDHIPDESESVDPFAAAKNRRLAGITGQKELIEEMKKSGPQEDPMKDFGHKKIADREDSYHQRRLNRGALSPERLDPFSMPAAPVQKQVGTKRTYYDIITEQSLENERADIYRKIEKKQEEEKKGPPPAPKRQRFDDTTSTANVTVKSYKQQPSEWDKKEVGDVKQAVRESTRISTKWDTPKRTPAMDGATPRRNRWDLTPSGQAPGISGTTTHSRFSQTIGGETPTPGRWSQATPMRMMAETPTPG